MPMPVPMPVVVQMLPGMESMATVMMKQKMAGKGVASIDDLMDIVYEDEDDDWAEKPSIRLVGRAEMAEVMEQQDVILSF